MGQGIQKASFGSAAVGTYSRRIDVCTFGSRLLFRRNCSGNGLAEV